MYQGILVYVDGGERSAQHIRLAAGLASRSEAHLTGLYVVLAQKPIRVILINELGSRSDGEVCAVATRSSVGRSLSLV